MSEIWKLGLAETARLIETREISPVEVVDHYLDRANALNAAVNCYVRIEDDSARASAKVAEAEIMAGRYKGAMHGIPYALKDIIDVAGLPTTNGSRLTLNDIAAEDSAVVEHLSAAGSILLGKAETQEFAIGGPDFSLPHGPARNPWNLDRFTGGSSSGSGSAVAAATVPLAIGTDTGGSVRTPSAYCGLVGMKPTYGRISRRGITQQAYSLETAGPMTWTVKDNAIALEALAGYDRLDPASADIAPQAWSMAVDMGVKAMKIGLVRNFHEQEPDGFSDEIVSAFELAAKVLKDAGAEIVEVELSPLRHYFAAQRVIMYGEAAAFHEDDFRSNLHLYGPYAIERFLPGFLLTAADYVQASRRRGELIRELKEAMCEVDLLLVVGAVGAAPLIKGIEPGSLLNGTLSANAPFNLTGSPAMIVPTGLNPSGLPLAVQIVGRHFDEFSVYQAAQVIETALGCRNIYPEITAGKC